MPFRRVSENKVRTALGPELTIDREDEKYLYYRVYRVDLAPSLDVAERKRELEAHVAEIRAAFPAPLPEVDQLVGVDFGHGLPAEGQWRNSFEFADMNEDGVLDLVHGPPRKGGREPDLRFSK